MLQLLSCTAMLYFFSVTAAMNLHCNDFRALFLGDDRAGGDNSVASWSGWGSTLAGPCYRNPAAERYSDVEMSDDEMWLSEVHHPYALGAQLPHMDTGASKGASVYSQLLQQPSVNYAPGVGWRRSCRLLEALTEALSQAHPESAGTPRVGCRWEWIA
jgi:hypothetical protein